MAKLWFLSCFLLLGVGTAHTQEQVPARDAILELKQFETPFQVNFHPAAESLGFAQRDGKVLSNAFVAIDVDPFQGRREAERVRAMVSTWVDPRGHVHTITVLKRQLAFADTYRALLSNERTEDGYCDGKGCWLSFARTKPLFVPNVPLTGILDMQTLLIPVWRLELRFDRLARRFAFGPRAEAAELSYWAGKAGAAREAIDALRAALEQVPLIRPAAAVGTMKTMGEGLGGLQEVPVPETEWSIALGWPTTSFSHGGTHVDSEATIEESADPTRLGADRVARLRELEEAAIGAVVDAERAQWVIFGDTE